MSGQRPYDWPPPQLISWLVQLEAVIDQEMAVTRTAVRVLEHLPPKATEIGICTPACYKRGILYHLDWGERRLGLPIQHVENYELNSWR